MGNPLVSVVVPAFNEENTIAAVIGGICRTLKTTGISYEVVVVDDGSADGTARIAQEHDVVLVKNNRNLGKGSSLKHGFMKSRGKYIVTMDADGSHKSEDLPKLISPMIRDEAEVVIGSRFNSRVSKNSTSKLHRIGNMIINMMILFLTGKYVSDSQSGFRAYRRDILGKLSFHSCRYEIESELIVRMLRKGFRIREVPIECMRRRSGCSKISSFRDGFDILKAILKAVLY